MDDVSHVVDETATEYYKESFITKSFDGNPWKQDNAKRTGSLMVQSGNLQNNITPAVISCERVIISAGNDKVDYAQPHNEGFSGLIIVNFFAAKTGRK